MMTMMMMMTRRMRLVFYQHEHVYMYIFIKRFLANENYFSVYNEVLIIYTLQLQEGRSYGKSLNYVLCKCIPYKLMHTKLKLHGVSL